MADIAAADVTWSLIHRILTPQPGSDRVGVQAVGQITVDPGTADTYPTGGIPLTNVFTDYTGIDVTKPILGVVSMVRNNAGVATFIKGYFYNGGTTAASQTLVLTNIVEGGATAAIQEAELANSDITGANFLGGDNDMICDIVLYGTGIEGLS